MSKLYLVQGDSLPRVTLVITDLEDNPTSLAGCTGALIYMRRVGQQGAAVTPITADVDLPSGSISFDFSNGELAEPGDFELEVELDFAGQKQTLYRPIKARVRPQFS